MDVSRETPDVTNKPKCYDLSNMLVPGRLGPGHVPAGPAHLRRARGEDQAVRGQCGHQGQGRAWGKHTNTILKTREQAETTKNNKYERERQRDGRKGGTRGEERGREGRGREGRRGEGRRSQTAGQCMALAEKIAKEDGCAATVETSPPRRFGLCDVNPETEDPYCRGFDSNTLLY